MLCVALLLCRLKLVNEWLEKSIYQHYSLISLITVIEIPKDELKRLDTKVINDVECKRIFIWNIITLRLLVSRLKALNKSYTIVDNIMKILKSPTLGLKFLTKATQLLIMSWKFLEVLRITYNTCNLKNMDFMFSSSYILNNPYCLKHLPWILLLVCYLHN